MIKKRDLLERIEELENVMWKDKLDVLMKENGIEYNYWGNIIYKGIASNIVYKGIAISAGWDSISNYKEQFTFVTNLLNRKDVYIAMQEIDKDFNSKKKDGTTKTTKNAKVKKARV